METLKWNVKKCSDSTKKRKGSKGKKRDNRGDRWKTNNKMVNLNYINNYIKH